MLTTLIYASKCSSDYAPDLQQLEGVFRRLNEVNKITGLLLFNGEQFFQILEGPEANVDRVFEQIKLDKRHTNIVKIMEDNSPTRKFAEYGMRALDIRSEDILNEGSPTLRLAMDARLPPSDRIIKLIQAFVQGRWNTPNADICNVTTPSPKVSQHEPSQPPRSNLYCQFALQPIVDPIGRKVWSYEALIRSVSGGSPVECFAGKQGYELYEFDLFSKQFALQLTSDLGLRENISINLLPMSLVSLPNAAKQLESYVKEAGLLPEQIIVEITEDEVITHYDEFSSALKQLRALGFGLAIDDFGAGFAGLSLLTKFQPEKLKIDRSIIMGIEQDGPRQAIVRATIDSCTSLGITIVAEGVETIDEWCWLQSTGINLFQGFLFARPSVSKAPTIHWPTLAAPAPTPH